ncbi:hypothetical protein M408DRAFT_333649 [Serendipita vermifera MAFF 305830]|uniref:Uncharacterized protein n=1 Tax=Serendipita vermifera MAFF 305830 TaxID=933852 RepID=A0A0C3APJ9_SERVB|nr:hypothetical protein M408DRAFT_333649 [Serendipita vermifera MAFF 305830]
MIFTSLLTTLAFAVMGANAAVPQAICGSHGLFLNTQSGHTPCDIASLLVGNGVKSADSPFPELNSLGVDRYPVPTGDQADELRCNPVFYNLASACGACQASTFNWTTWTEWTANCQTVSSPAYVIQRMPSDIPLPGWAFVPPAVTNGTFDKVAAYAESFATIPDSYFPKLVVTATNVCSTPKMSPGELAGAIVGGVIGVGLLGLLAVLLFRRRRNATSTTTRVLGRTVSQGSSVDSIMRQKAVA